MGKGLTQREWRLLLARDGYCLHCGETERVAPNHRRNRGMGGSTDDGTNSSANLMVLCSLANGLLESDPAMAATARLNGWKLASWESTDRPVYDRLTATWWVLDDDYGRAPLDTRNKPQ